MRQRDFRVDERMIFESASLSSLLKLFQCQKFGAQKEFFLSIIENLSRQQNGSRRMASSDGPLIQLGNMPVSKSSMRVMALTAD